MTDRANSPDIDVILTHEHTDFDALASLHAASLLYPNALPVLPSQMNRSVQEFVEEHSARYAFIDRDDLPRGDIGRIVLVDTRKASDVRGNLFEHRNVHVIDHHQIDKPLPEGWTLEHEPLGANATMLVEKLREREIALSPEEASLLALGIHADTGSLTYGATTARDAAALAWLMQSKQGANLEMIRPYLHHPLSDPQRALLRRLKEAAQYIDVARYQVCLAAVDATDFEDEYSVLATRMRDELDVDAAILLLAEETDDESNVQVVARSSTDDINVGEIARSLGGNGHTRAAAAHLSDVMLAEVQAQIFAQLHEIADAQKAVQRQVSQIMSWTRPRTLQPDMPVHDAHLLMRRYGHEGFPVVAAPEGDAPTQLLGLLTRRQADRAVDHGLGSQPVRRFMEGGTVTVQPTTSIDELRLLMHREGWGQVPVVDESGRIIGIVTRTDLVRLHEQERQQKHSADDIAAMMERVLLPSRLGLLRLLGDIADQSGHDIYVVGGFVRDLLLGEYSSESTFDLDIVIQGDAIAFGQQMRRRFGGRIVPHERFGTANWILDDNGHRVRQGALQEAIADHLPGGQEFLIKNLPNNLDFVTARTEFYTAPTVLPTVESSSIKFDLHRRDFTINTLAIRLNLGRWAELLDEYGGVSDLERGIVRVLHSLSFVDDPTRIWRAARYEQRFSFQIEPQTGELLREALPLLNRVTASRIRHELLRTLQEDLPEKTLWRLDELGILATLNEGLRMTQWAEEHFAALRTIQEEMCEVVTGDEANNGECWQRSTMPSVGLRHLLCKERIERLYWSIFMFPLAADIDEAIAARLRLRQDTQELINGLRALQQQQDTLTDPELRPSCATAILELLSPIALAVMCMACDNARLQQVLSRYYDEWRHVEPVLSGYDLREMGLTPSPLYKKILGELRMAQLDGQVQSRAEAVDFAQAIVAREAQGETPIGHRHQLDDRNTERTMNKQIER